MKKLIITIFVLALFISIGSNALCYIGKSNEMLNIEKGMEKFRNFEISDQVISDFRDTRKKDTWIDEITKNMLVNDFKLTSDKDTIGHFSWWNVFYKKENGQYYEPLYYSILNDLAYFPVPEDTQGKQTVSFDNSWGSDRTYGGERRHEGTDIMTSNNVAGYFPVISATDGTVEKMGWLNLGGYRLGIRAPSGAYFYYAHMDKYVEGLKEGDTVKAGQLIGTMGNTGYGAEGTKGKFDVHLHFGIYINIEGKEVSVNPYYILKYLEKHKKSFSKA